MTGKLRRGACLFLPPRDEKEVLCSLVLFLEDAAFVSLSPRMIKGKKRARDIKGGRKGVGRVSDSSFPEFF